MFTQEVADQVCQKLAEGQSLRKACSVEGMPAASTVLLWTRAQGGFSEQYTRAREIGYQLLADQILEISDDKAGDVARDRLSVDSRKWMLSKMLPKVYGDKIETQHTGDVTVRTVEHRIIDTAN